MHADIKIPENAVDGEEIRIRHKGVIKIVKIPAGQQGQTIRLKMVSLAVADESREPSTGLLCCM